MIGDIEQPKQPEDPIEQGSVGAVPTVPQPSAQDVLPNADQTDAMLAPAAVSAQEKEPSNPEFEPWPLQPPVTLEQLESALEHLSDDPDAQMLRDIGSQYNALRQRAQKPPDLQ